MGNALKRSLFFCPDAFGTIYDIFINWKFLGFTVIYESIITNRLVFLDNTPSSAQLGK